MSRRRLVIGGGIAAFLATCALVVVLGQWFVMIEAGDRCATTAPPNAVGSRVDFSSLPGTWTCVYRDENEREWHERRVIWNSKAREYAP